MGRKGIRPDWVKLLLLLADLLLEMCKFSGCQIVFRHRPRGVLRLGTFLPKVLDC